MYTIDKQNIKEQFQTNTADDPRIDSPEVQVIYPSPMDDTTKEQMQKGIPVALETQPIKAITEPIAPTETPTETPTEKKQKKIDFQQAVSQNILGFIAMVVISFGIGYLIGKK